MSVMTTLPTVLLVDDEVPFGETLARRLDRRGFRVLRAFSGADGLERLGTWLVDVVVLDVNMPGMGGLQVLREIKMRFPTVQVLMLTGHADMEAAISGMAMGTFDYLMKPVGLDELIRKIMDACSKGGQRGEACEVGDSPT